MPFRDPVQPIVTPLWKSTPQKSTDLVLENVFALILHLHESCSLTIATEEAPLSKEPLPVYLTASRICLHIRFSAPSSIWFDMGNLHLTSPLQLLGLPNSCRSFFLNSKGGAWWRAGQTRQVARQGSAGRMHGLHALVCQHTVTEDALWTRKNPQLLPAGLFSLSPVVMGFCYPSPTPPQHWYFTPVSSSLIPEASLAKISRKGKARTH